MNRGLAWVVGSSGLLGSHVLRAIQADMEGVRVWDPGKARIPWNDHPRALAELERHVTQFARDVTDGPRSWMVVWCAGSGVVGTTPEALAAETACLEFTLAQLGNHLPDLPGQVMLASSAGGVYGSNPEQPLTEASLCRPISDYGRNKLRQEGLLVSWAHTHPRVATLVARISNLYGPGQNISKPQGLIAHISRSLLHHTPVHVYVPLDTLRDYVYVADCATHLVRCLDRLRHGTASHVVKIFSAGETVTIAGIVAAFSRIAKGHPRIICAAAPASSLQPSRLQFKSTVWPDIPLPSRTSLAVGIQRVHQELLSRFQQGHLPPRQPN